jgi:hypothetical protein
MGGFFSMEQNARRNNGPNLEKGDGGYGPRTNNVRLTGANAPRVNNNQGSVNLETGLNSTRRNNGRNNNNRRNSSNSVASNPHELEEVVVTEPSATPPNTVVNVNRPSNRNNGRINVVATNEQVPLPPNTTPEGEEQVGGRRRRKSRKGRSRRGKSKRASK